MEAKALQIAHLTEVAEFEERIRLNRERNKELVKDHPERERWVDVSAGYSAVSDFNQRPRLLTKNLLPATAHHHCNDE